MDGAPIQYTVYRKLIGLTFALYIVPLEPDVTSLCTGDLIGDKVHCLGTAFLVHYLLRHGC